MYGIIREGNRKYYITKILGFYSDNENKKETFGQHFIVLDKEKKRLVKVYQFNPEVKPHLDLMVITMDDDMSDWIVDVNNHGCVGFLADKNLKELITENVFDAEMLAKCIEYDTPPSFCEINEIHSEKDIEQLMYITGEFHDATIEELEQMADGSLRVYFTGVWGCDVELYFDGDVTYCTDSRDPMEYDPYWGDSQVAIRDGYITFYDDAYTDVSEINDNWCWFRARKMLYKIIPL